MSLLRIAGPSVPASGLGPRAPVEAVLVTTAAAHARSATSICSFFATNFSPVRRHEISVLLRPRKMLTGGGGGVISSIICTPRSREIVIANPRAASAPESFCQVRMRRCPTRPQPHHIPPERTPATSGREAVVAMGCPVFSGLENQPARASILARSTVAGRRRTPGLPAPFRWRSSGCRSSRGHHVAARGIATVSDQGDSRVCFHSSMIAELDVNQAATCVRIKEALLAVTGLHPLPESDPFSARCLDLSRRCAALIRNAGRPSSRLLDAA